MIAAQTLPDREPLFDTLIESFRNKTIKANDIIVFTSMWKASKGSGQCWARNETIVQLSGLTESQVMRSKRRLESARFIEKVEQRRRGAGRFSTVLYKLYPIPRSVKLTLAATGKVSDGEAQSPPPKAALIQTPEPPTHAEHTHQCLRIPLETTTPQGEEEKDCVPEDAPKPTIYLVRKESREVKAIIDWYADRTEKTTGFRNSRHAFVNFAAKGISDGTFDTSEYEKEMKRKAKLEMPDPTLTKVNEWWNPEDPDLLRNQSKQEIANMFAAFKRTHGPACKAAFTPVRIR